MPMQTLLRLKTDLKVPLIRVKHRDHPIPPVAHPHAQDSDGANRNLVLVDGQNSRPTLKAVSKSGTACKMEGDPVDRGKSPAITRERSATPAPRASQRAAKGQTGQIPPANLTTSCQFRSRQASFATQNQTAHTPLPFHRISRPRSGVSRTPKDEFAMSLNIFRVLGDLSHLLSILILLHKMTQLKVRSVSRAEGTPADWSRELTRRFGIELLWYQLQVAGSLHGCLRLEISRYESVQPLARAHHRKLTPRRDRPLLD